MKIFLQAMFVLMFTSPVDFLIMLFNGEVVPHKPKLEEITAGSWYHKAKGYWAQCFRDDGEWWSKLARFVVWWQTVILIYFSI